MKKNRSNVIPIRAAPSAPARIDVKTVKAVELMGVEFLLARVTISRHLFLHPLYIWFREIDRCWSELTKDSPDSKYKEFFENDGALLGADIETYFQEVSESSVNSINLIFTSLGISAPSLKQKFDELKLDSGHAQRFAARVRAKCGPAQAAANALSNALRGANSSFEIISTHNSTDTSGEELIDNIVTGGLFFLNPLAGAAKLAFSAQANKKKSAQIDSINSRHLKDMQLIEKTIEQTRMHLIELGKQFEIIVEETVVGTYRQMKSGIESIPMDSFSVEAYWKHLLEPDQEITSEVIEVLQAWLKEDVKDIEEDLIPFLPLAHQALNICLESVSQRSNNQEEAA